MGTIKIYFFSYSFINNNIQGFGNITLGLDNFIASYEQIHGVELLINERFKNQYTTILNYSFLREEPKPIKSDGGHADA